MYAGQCLRWHCLVYLLDLCFVAVCYFLFSYIITSIMACYLVVTLSTVPTVCSVEDLLKFFQLDLTNCTKMEVDMKVTVWIIQWRPAAARQLHTVEARGFAQLPDISTFPLVSFISPYKWVSFPTSTDSVVWDTSGSVCVSLLLHTHTTSGDHFFCLYSTLTKWRDIIILLWFQ